MQTNQPSVRSTCSSKSRKIREAIQSPNKLSSWHLNPKISPSLDRIYEVSQRTISDWYSSKPLDFSSESSWRAKPRRSGLNSPVRQVDRYYTVSVFIGNNQTKIFKSRSDDGTGPCLGSLDDLLTTTAAMFSSIDRVNQAALVICSVQGLVYNYTSVYFPLLRWLILSDSSVTCVG